MDRERLLYWGQDYTIKDEVCFNNSFAIAHIGQTPSINCVWWFVYQPLPTGSSSASTNISTTLLIAITSPPNHLHICLRPPLNIFSITSSIHEFRNGQWLSYHLEGGSPLVMIRMQHATDVLSNIALLERIWLCSKHTMHNIRRHGIWKRLL